MPKKRPIYACNYCGAEFDSYDEALECEISHEKNYDEASPEEILKELKNIKDVAPGYHIGNEVLGYPVSSFCSILDRTIELLKAKKSITHD